MVEVKSVVGEEVRNTMYRIAVLCTYYLLLLFICE